MSEDAWRVDPAECLARGLALENQGRYADAEVCFRAAVAGRPGWAEAHYHHASALQDVGRIDEALAETERALVARPAYAEAHNLRGNLLQDAGQPGSALACYAEALVLRPDYAAALHNRGNTLLKLGRLDDAAASFEGAIGARPELAQAHDGLGLARLGQGRLEQAAAAFARALALAPGLVHTCVNLGHALSGLDRIDDAEDAFRRALALAPDHVEATYGLGRLARREGRLNEAIALFSRAVAHKPDFALAYADLGDAYKAQGRRAEAVACYERVCAIEPENEAARFLIAALTGEDLATAPAAAIARMFDGYANRFDAHLVDVLHYDVPAETVRALGRVTALPDRGWDVLDLGCGTGLVGAVMRPHARRLVGVDLSARMVAKAAERGVYDRVARADLLALMQGEPDASYDVVVAADVFIYVGSIDAIVAEIRRILRPGGRFVFSAEALATIPGGPAFKLDVTGRFVHTAPYLASLAARHALDALLVDDVPFRLEHGRPVDGWIIVWRRSS